MDLSGAYNPNLTTYVYSDCSGEQYIPLSNSNVPDTNPAPYTSDGTRITEDDRLLGLYHSSNELRNRNRTGKSTSVFECPVSQALRDVSVRESWAVSCSSATARASSSSSDSDSEGDGGISPVEHDTKAPNENEDENENEDANENEEVTQDQVNQMRTYLMARSPWISKDQVLMYSVRLVNFVWGFLVNSLQYSQKITTGLYSAFQSEVYYFVNDSAHPWDARRLNLTRAGSPHVDWYYNADTKTFSRQENNGHLHHFPYLTAEIYHGNLALYDITPFTEGIKWTGGDDAPSANHVLSAWTLHSGILLDFSLPLVLKVITQEGDEATISLNSPTAAAAST